MWNHRVVYNKKDKSYDVHEVYYDDDLKPNGWVADGLFGGCSSRWELFWWMFRVLRGTFTKRTLTYDGSNVLK